MTCREGKVEARRPHRNPLQKAKWRGEFSWSDSTADRAAIGSWRAASSALQVSKSFSSLTSQLPCHSPDDVPDHTTGWGKGRCAVVCMENNAVIHKYKSCQTHNCTPAFAPPRLKAGSHLPASEPVTTAPCLLPPQRSVLLEAILLIYLLFPPFPK